MLHNDWREGDRLSSKYRDRNYVVDDSLGQQWDGVNGDYVLAAVAAGIIANVLLSAR
ncbi:RcnB family protein [Paraburkholderia aromaticivorans]|uniref:RcnB family protein n=1 Tax=Paraburkholderia aromaticivorans TaxID=2026199 RepID=UPI0038B8AB8E